MTTNDLQYSQLMIELTQLLQKLERDNISIDELSNELSRGFDLITALKQKLTQTEARIEDIISARTLPTTPDNS